MDEIMQLLKIDLGITHNARDTFFNALIISAENELIEKGIELNKALIDDQMLISDYAVWQYRKRQEDVPLSQSLQWRIRNRIVKGRAI